MTGPAATLQRRHLLWLLATLGAPAAAVQPETIRVADLGNVAVPGMSEAERLLFVQEHLANVEPPRTLRYRYVREGAPEGKVVDQATLQLVRGEDGRCCAAHAEYLTGERTMRLPDIPEARANPILLFFLEQQVRQMQSRTRGQAAHFRRRARLALADDATVTAGTIRWGNADVPSRTVRITPYRDDPYRDRFAQEAATEYSFVVSDAVPGVIYQLRAALSGGPAAREETLTLEGAEAANTTR